MVYYGTSFNLGRFSWNQFVQILMGNHVNDLRLGYNICGVFTQDRVWREVVWQGLGSRSRNIWGHLQKPRTEWKDEYDTRVNSGKLVVVRLTKWMSLITRHKALALVVKQNWFLLLTWLSRYLSHRHYLLKSQNSSAFIYLVHLRYIILSWQD